MTTVPMASDPGAQPEDAFGSFGPFGDDIVAADADSAQLLDERALSKLRWRCRRGLLENDLFIDRFFKRHESGLTVGQARGLSVLMDLADNDLLDLLLKRKEPEVGITTTEVREVLAMLRT